MMKFKIKIRSVLFVAILAVILMLLSAFINKIYDRDVNMISNRSKTYVALGREKKETIDLLVIGDSETYTTISPMTLWNLQGITAYVGGQHGQQLYEAKRMMERGFERQKPRVVMLETNMFFRKVKPEFKIFDGLQKVKAKYFSIFQEHNVWKQLIRTSMGIKPVKDYKGFKIKTQVAAYKGGDYMQWTGEKQKIVSSVRDTVKDMVGFCKKNKVKIIFYSAPAPKNCDYKKHNAVEAFAKKLKVDYIDLNLAVEDIGIDWMQDSLDEGDHLNVRGAEKITRYLAEDLAKKYHLPDHRGDERYREWQELAENYKKELETLD